MTALASASDLAPAPPRDASCHYDQELLSLIHSLPPDSAQRATAREVLVGRFQPLVRSCARRYLGRLESPEELMQVGYVGLMKAINRFDPAAASSLASNALPRISGEMKPHFRDQRISSGSC
jgi:DNA-directed RNA polymerase specialized sigma subunit